MAVIEFGTRHVVSIKLTPTSKTTNWLLDAGDVISLEGVTMVALTHSSDRGFAKFIGADMNASNPLRLYTWLDSLKQLRNEAVTQLLRTAQADADGFRDGGRLHRNKYASKIAQTVTVQLPGLTDGSDQINGISLKLKTEVVSSTPVFVECTPDTLAYIRHAMIASKLDPNVSDGVPRKRSKHDDRMSALVGTKGALSIVKRGRQRVGATSKDEDGRTHTKSYATNSRDPDELKHAFELAIAPPDALVKMELPPDEDANAAHDDAPDASDNEAADRVGTAVTITSNARDADADPQVSCASSSASSSVAPASLHSKWGHIFTMKK